MNELTTIYDGDPLEKELLKKDISFYDFSTKKFKPNNMYRNYIPAMRSSSDGTIIARIIYHLKVIEEFKQKNVIYLLRKQSNKSFYDLKFKIIKYKTTEHLGRDHFKDCVSKEEFVDMVYNYKEFYYSSILAYMFLSEDDAIPELEKIAIMM